MILGISGTTEAHHPPQRTHTPNWQITQEKNYNRLLFKCGRGCGFDIQRSKRIREINDRFRETRNKKIQEQKSDEKFKFAFYIFIGCIISEIIFGIIGIIRFILNYAVKKLLYRLFFK